jgi:Winged helix DNA-binding domain
MAGGVGTRLGGGLWEGRAWRAAGVAGGGRGVADAAWRTRRGARGAAWRGVASGPGAGVADRLAGRPLLATFVGYCPGREGDVVRRVGVEERRARLAVRQRLAPMARAAGPVEVADSLVGLHATDPASVYLAIRARADVKPDAVGQALYEDRTLVRMLGMRRTMFTVSVAVAGIVQASSTRAIAVNERRKLVQMLDGAGLGADIEGWLADLERATLAALAVRGEATATELAVDEPRLAEKVLLAAGKSYEAWQSVSTRVLFLLAADGHIVRARPRGSWISSQYRWSPVRTWLPDGLPDWPVEAARVELVRRWLASFGPGTVADLKWWTGWTMGDVRRALKELDLVDVDLDGVPGLMLAADVDEPSSPAEPWVALLPGLDPTPMGWAGRDWYLGPHAGALFDRSGNIGPTVWCDGRIVGGWAQRPDGEIGYRLLEDVGADTSAAVAIEAGRLAEWIGPVRVTPRFRTPLEKELAGGG